ncbi:uncharacterized protein LOC107874266 [Capsicum annuum]|uniref:uncharacterized protein LOC107874266 n=1 Tax=Capsicum annuum TaxID=4072 RepID=UPI001FB0AF3E|nr:uncharacterized protein LOC107874266 [Capsicum annuum]
MDFARLSVHMQQVEEKKKKTAESRKKNRQAKRARAIDQSHSQQHSGNWDRKWRCGRNHSERCQFGALVCYSCGQPGHIQRDCPAAKSNVGGAKSQVNSSTPPPQKGAALAIGNGRNRLYALTNRQEAEASPDVVTGILQIFSRDVYIMYLKRFDVQARSSVLTEGYMDKARPIFGIQTRSRVVTSDCPRGVPPVPTNPTFGGDTSPQSPQNVGFHHFFSMLAQVGGKWSKKKYWVGPNFHSAASAPYPNPFNAHRA